jgi:hypothetical protein
LQTDQHITMMIKKEKEETKNEGEKERGHLSSYFMKTTVL